MRRAGEVSANMAAAHLPSDTREGQSTNSKASSDCLLVDKLNRQLFWVYMARLGGGMEQKGCPLRAEPSSYPMLAQSQLQTA